MSRRPLFKPGSLAWLVRHEVRLGWRAIGSRNGKLGIRPVYVVLLVLLAIAAHVGAWFVVRALPHGAWPDGATWIAGGFTWLVVSLMLSQAILQSVTALFDRGDFDLLLSSPLDSRHVFAARALGIAAGVITLYLFLLAPFADVGPFAGHPELLAIYPTLAGIALAVTAIGMWLTLALVRLVGARRARTLAQVMGAIVGAGIFLCGQAPNMLGHDASRALFARLAAWAAPGGPLAVDSALWFPARALMGDALALFTVVATGLALIVGVVRLTHRRFVAGTQESVVGSARRAPAAPGAGRARFRTGLARTVLMKEWRLIARDPQLISATLMQVLYLVPAMVLMVRGGGQGLGALVPGVVFLGASLASHLAWITVAAEDAPELLGTSPNPRLRLRTLKVLAALLPVWLLVSPVLGWLLVHDLRLAAIFVATMLGGTISIGAAQIAWPRTGQRNDLKRRMQGNGVVGVLELMVIGGWVGTAWGLVAASWWTLLALAVTATGMGVVWLLGRSRRADDAPNPA